MSTLREGERIGPYVVETVLPEGHGGYSYVVVARQVLGQDSSERVALKIARTRIRTDDPAKAEDLIELFGRSVSAEAEMLRQIKHPGIIRIYPVPLDEKRVIYAARALELDKQPWYFAMEYLEGNSLEAWLDRRRTLDLPLAVEVAQQVCAALDYMHAKGFAHLDIKSSNILFRNALSEGIKPEAVLVDFGTAQKLRHRVDQDGLTLAYASPERVRVREGASPESIMDKAAADIYSLGVVLYKMLTGHLPFTGERDHITTAILNTPPTRPQIYSQALKRLPALDNLIMQMLDKEPSMRPTAKDVMIKLEDIVPSPRLKTTQRPVRNNSAAAGTNGTWRNLAVTFGLVAALELGGALYLWQAGNLTIPVIVPTRTMTFETPTSPPKPTPTPSRKPTRTPVTRQPTATFADPTATSNPQEEPTSTPRPTFTTRPTLTPRPPATATPLPTTGASD